MHWATKTRKNGSQPLADNAGCDSDCSQCGVKVWRSVSQRGGCVVLLPLMLPVTPAAG
jgi:hypothetical protein